MIPQNHPVHHRIVPSYWIVVVPVQRSYTGAGLLEVFHGGVIPQMPHGPFFDFFGLQQFHLELPLDDQGRTGEAGAAVVQVAQ